MAKFYKYKCKNNACDVWYFTADRERLPEECDCGYVLGKQPAHKQPVSLDSLSLDKDDIEQDIKDHGYFKGKAHVEISGEKWVKL